MNNNLSHIMCNLVIYDSTYLSNTVKLDETLKNTEKSD